MSILFQKISSEVHLHIFFTAITIMLFYPRSSFSMNQLSGSEEIKNSVHLKQCHRKQIRQESIVRLMSQAECWINSPLSKLELRLAPLIQNLSNLMIRYESIFEGSNEGASDIAKQVENLKKEILAEISFEKEMMEMKLTSLYNGQRLLNNDYTNSRLSAEISRKIESLEEFSNLHLDQQLNEFKNVVESITDSVLESE